jgi:hypothetical protein
MHRAGRRLVALEVTSAREIATRITKPPTRVAARLIFWKIRPPQACWLIGDGGPSG